VSANNDDDFDRKMANSREFDNTVLIVFNELNEKRNINQNKNDRSEKETRNW
jgi:hypothetical protein